LSNRKTGIVTAAILSGYAKKIRFKVSIYFQSSRAHWKYVERIGNKKPGIFPIISIPWLA